MPLANEFMNAYNMEQTGLDEDYRRALRNLTPSLQTRGLSRSPISVYAAKPLMEAYTREKSKRLSDLLATGATMERQERLQREQNLLNAGEREKQRQFLSSEAEKAFNRQKAYQEDVTNKAEKKQRLSNVLNTVAGVAGAVLAPSTFGLSTALTAKALAGKALLGAMFKGSGLANIYGTKLGMDFYKNVFSDDMMDKFMKAIHSGKITTVGLEE